ncbi:MAG: hypothetical protein M1831_004704 [Alyxoria varia]|nr:MAG: hypothetical protein M1831_004704 [Alyxoria varia]
MGNKKRKGPSLEQVLERPWCYYCERDFDDMAVLINHQKAKHFKCDRCNRRLNTAGGLSVHLDQVHKVELKQVENSLENRKLPNIEIFGMEGIPDDVAEQHRQRVIAHFHEVQAEHQARTGNPPAGGNAGGANKKVKHEDPNGVKARLAEFRAKKAAGLISKSGENTAQSTPPDTAGSPMQTGQTPGTAYLGGQAGSPPPGYQQGFGQPGYAAPPPTYNAPPQQWAPGAPGMPPYGQPPHTQQYPYPGSPPPQMPFRTPQNNSASPPQNASMHGAPPRPGFSQGPPGYSPQQNPGGNGPNALQAPPGQSPQPPGTANETKSAPAHETTSAAADEKKKDSKKKKEERATKLLYSDNNVSPEEKMAKMSKYFFDPAERGEQVALGNALDAPGVAGTVQG